jgi:hypothetical protein
MRRKEHRPTSSQPTTACNVLFAMTRNSIENVNSDSMA